MQICHDPSTEAHARQKPKESRNINLLSMFNWNFLHLFQFSLDSFKLDRNQTQAHMHETSQIETMNINLQKIFWYFTKSDIGFNWYLLYLSLAFLLNVFWDNK